MGAFGISTLLKDARSRACQNLGRTTGALSWKTIGNETEENLARLTELGWDVLVVWECQLRDVRSVEARIGSFLG